MAYLITSLNLKFKANSKDVATSLKSRSIFPCTLLLTPLQMCLWPYTGFRIGKQNWRRESNFLAWPASVSTQGHACLLKAPQTGRTLISITACSMLWVWDVRSNMKLWDCWDLLGTDFSWCLWAISFLVGLAFVWAASFPLWWFQSLSDCTARKLG